MIENIEKYTNIFASIVLIMNLINVPLLVFFSAFWFWLLNIYFFSSLILYRSYLV